MAEEEEPGTKWDTDVLVALESGSKTFEELLQEALPSHWEGEWILTSLDSLVLEGLVNYSQDGTEVYSLTDKGKEVMANF